MPAEEKLKRLEEFTLAVGLLFAVIAAILITGSLNNDIASARTFSGMGAGLGIAAFCNLVVFMVSKT